jgi:hypothetical protein
MPPRTRKRIRRRPLPPPRRAAHPRRLFEALLSLVVLGAAYEWTQGSEPEPWYADRRAEASAPGEEWAFGIRSANDLGFRTDGWAVPLVAGPADPVAVCSLAVGELWAGTAADPVTGQVGRDAVCALPMPGRWTARPSFGESSDVLAALVPAADPARQAAPASRTSPHSAAAALTGRSGTVRPADLFAVIGDDDR